MRNETFHGPSAEPEKDDISDFEFLLEQAIQKASVLARVISKSELSSDSDATRYASVVEGLENILDRKVEITKDKAKLADARSELQKLIDRIVSHINTYRE